MIYNALTVQANLIRNIFRFNNMPSAAIHYFRIEGQGAERVACVVQSRILHLG